MQNRFILKLLRVALLIAYLPSQMLWQTRNTFIIGVNNSLHYLWCFIDIFRSVIRNTQIYGKMRLIYKVIYIGF